MILIGGTKGGTGKTTIAINLAVQRALNGKDVLLVDTDRQGSASQWAKMRKKNTIKPNITCIPLFGETLGEELLSMKPRFDEIIIDAGGFDSEELRQALGVCSKAIIPIQTSFFDVKTFNAIQQLVKSAKSFNPKLEAFVLLNRASTHPSDVEVTETKAVLDKFKYLSKLDSIIHNRKVYQDIAKEGQSVVEFSRGKAVSEIKYLDGEIYA